MPPRHDIPPDASEREISESDLSRIRRGRYLSEPRPPTSDLSRIRGRDLSDLSRTAVGSESDLSRTSVGSRSESTEVESRQGEGQICRGNWGKSFPKPGVLSFGGVNTLQTCQPCNLF
jgi:hypothetical protein